MDAINTNHNASQAVSQLVQQNAQQAAAPPPQQASGAEEAGEHVPETTETGEGNLGQNINTHA